MFPPWFRNPKGMSSKRTVESNTHLKRFLTDPINKPSILNVKGPLQLSELTDLLVTVEPADRNTITAVTRYILDHLLLSSTENPQITTDIINILQRDSTDNILIVLWDLLVNCGALCETILVTYHLQNFQIQLENTLRNKLSERLDDNSTSTCLIITREYLKRPVNNNFQIVLAHENQQSTRAYTGFFPENQHLLINDPRIDGHPL